MNQLVGSEQRVGCDDFLPIHTSEGCGEETELLHGQNLVVDDNQVSDVVYVGTENEDERLKDGLGRVSKHE